jgi:hypothetical protein
MDDKPLPNVLVTFVPASGGAVSTGVTDGDGNYELLFTDRKGAMVGKHKVSVTTIQKPPEAQGGIAAGTPSNSPDYEKLVADPAAAYAAVPKFVEPIPARYNAQTQLEEVVEEGDNEIDLKLSSKE